MSERAHVVELYKNTPPYNDIPEFNLRNQVMRDVYDQQRRLFVRSLEHCINYVLSEHYGLPLNEEIYRRISRIEFEDEPGWGEYRLDYESPESKGLFVLKCTFDISGPTDDHFSPHSINCAFKYHAPCDIPDLDEDYDKKWLANLDHLLTSIKRKGFH